MTLTAMPARASILPTYNHLSQSNKSLPARQQPLQFGHSETPKDNFSLTSDNCAPTAKPYLDALIKVANRYDDTYNHDLTESPAAHKMLEDIFGEGTKTVFTNNGTVTNTSLLKSIMNSTDAVISTNVGHISSRAAGSVESNIGAKVMTVKHENGKLTIKALKQIIEPPEGKKNFTKIQQPRVISISQPTELGTIYTQQEIKDIADYAHERGMLLHMDGARLFNAAASAPFRSFPNPLKAMTTDAGVDLLYLGGTKNNMDTVEAAIYTPNFFKNYPAQLTRNNQLTKSKFTIENGELRLNREAGNPFDRESEVIIKQLGSLSAKAAKGVSAQVKVALTDNYAIKTAIHANTKAQELAQKLQAAGFILTQDKPDTNVVIMSLPLPLAKMISSDNYLKRLKIMDIDPTRPNHGLMRLNTNGLTTDKDLETAVNYLKQVKERYHRQYSEDGTPKSKL
jgi:threonine aldolase